MIKIADLTTPEIKALEQIKPGCTDNEKVICIPNLEVEECNRKWKVWRDKKRVSSAKSYYRRKGR